MNEYEAITKAADCAQLLVSDLRQALPFMSESVTGDIVVCQLIRTAAGIAATLDRLQAEALRKDRKND